MAHWLPFREEKKSFMILPPDLRVVPTKALVTMATPAEKNAPPRNIRPLTTTLTPNWMTCSVVMLNSAPPSR